MTKIFFLDRINSSEMKRKKTKDSKKIFWHLGKKLKRSFHFTTDLQLPVLI